MKRKILIVEDNMSLSQMQKDWFFQAGYDAMTAMSEPIARALIRPEIHFGASSQSFGLNVYLDDFDIVG